MPRRVVQRCHPRPYPLGLNDASIRLTLLCDFKIFLDLSEGKWHIRHIAG